MEKNTTPAVDEMAGVNITGNVIPPLWFKKIQIKTKRGTYADLLAINLLADIVYWYKPSIYRDEATGAVISAKKKFHGDMLQRSYDQFAEQFGTTKEIVKPSLKNLVSLGLVTIQFRTVNVKGLNVANVMYVEPIPHKINQFSNDFSEESQKTHVGEITHTLRSIDHDHVGEITHTNTKSNTKTNKKEIKPKNVVLGNSLFETFWNAFDKRIAKQKTITAFSRLPLADQQAAIDGLPAYNEFLSRPENAYLEKMHPTTYLNQKRWNDEYPPSKNEAPQLADLTLDPPTAEIYNTAKERIYHDYPALKEVPFFKHSEFVNFKNLTSEYLGANWKTRATQRQVKETHCQLLKKLNDTPYLRKACSGIYPYLQTEMKKILYQQ